MKRRRRLSILSVDYDTPSDVTVRSSGWRKPANFSLNFSGFKTKFILVEMLRKVQNWAPGLLYTTSVQQQIYL